MNLCPINRDEANAFVEKFHRHAPRVAGHKFAIAVEKNGEIRGVIICGRPIARAFDNGYTIEARRCCTDGLEHACSKLYAAAWRAAKAMGYRRLVTYTRDYEPGTSLRAAGMRVVHQTKNDCWSTPARPRFDASEQLHGQKTLWELTA